MAQAGTELAVQGCIISCIQYSYLFINKNNIYGMTLTRPKNKQRFYIKGKNIRFGSFENSQLKELGYII